MEEYIINIIDCPECGGEGYVERMTWLAYDGDQTWKRDECPECHGDRIVEIRAKCVECGEEMIVSEAIELNDVRFAHLDCLDPDA